MRIVLITHDEEVEIETRCAQARPCAHYSEAMALSARARALGDDDIASRLILAARWHRLVALHPELDDLDR
jgi:hypothetical protein